MVVLIGKTGKESLKRRVMEFKVKNLKPELAAEVKTMFSKFDLIEVRDGSSGAATFYIWVRRPIYCMVALLTCFDLTQQNYIFSFWLLSEIKLSVS